MLLPQRGRTAAYVGAGQTATFSLRLQSHLVESARQVVVLKIMATCDVEADLGGYGSLKKLSFALSVYVNVYVRLCTCFLR